MISCHIKSRILMKTPFQQVVVSITAELRTQKPSRQLEAKLSDSHYANKA